MWSYGDMFWSSLKLYDSYLGIHQTMTQMRKLQLFFFWKFLNGYWSISSSDIMCLENDFKNLKVVKE